MVFFLLFSKYFPFEQYWVAWHSYREYPQQFYSLSYQLIETFPSFFMFHNFASVYRYLPSTCFSFLAISHKSLSPFLSLTTLPFWASESTYLCNIISPLIHLHTSLSTLSHLEKMREMLERHNLEEELKILLICSVDLSQVLVAISLRFAYCPRLFFAEEVVIRWLNDEPFLFLQG